MSSNTIDLVAGKGLSGFKDGHFTQALFNKPLGLAMSLDGTRIFVADSENNRVRIIHLDQANQVTTLMGKDFPGSQDGSIEAASLNQPRSLVYLPDDRLVINDAGNHLLRLADLKTGMVSILAGNPTSKLSEGPALQVSIGGIRDLVYLPAADSIFFTQPELGALKRLNLKTGLVELVAIHPEKPVPASLQAAAPTKTPVGAASDGLKEPTALCVVGDFLYVADRKSARVYKMEWKNGNGTKLVLAATATSTIRSLAASGKDLYALEASGEAPLERLLPVKQTVTFSSVWGDEIPEPGQNLPSFMNSGVKLNSLDPMGFVADPQNEKKFYIANPSMNIITSCRDLYGNPSSDFSGVDFRNANGISDFDYPARKPPHTFRILFAGDSRSSMVVNHYFKNTYMTQTGDKCPRQLSISKRMELSLNALAALDDINTNFEVLDLSRSAGDPLFLWPTYEIPEIAQKNDIDLVVILLPPSPSAIFPFTTYFERPLNKEGIPINTTDGEFLLKPPLERIAKGEPSRFYGLCKSKKLVKIKGNNFIFNKSLFADPQLFDSLVQLYGKPLDMLNRKLLKMRTSAGKPVRLLICYTHTGAFAPDPEEGGIWQGVGLQFHFPFINLDEEITALGLSFFPFGEFGGEGHFDTDGHLFFGLLFAHALIQKGSIPWEKNPSLSTRP